MRLLLFCSFFYFCTASLSAQEVQNNHQLQIGYYKSESKWPGIGMQYQYFLSDHFSLLGGLLIYNRQSAALDIVDYMSRRENNERLFAQVPYYVPVNQADLGNDDYTLHRKIYNRTYSLFSVEPEIGIGFNSPRLLWNRLQFSLNYSMRLEIFSKTFLTEMGPMLWNSEDTEDRFYTIFYYNRSLGPIGFNLHPVLKFYISSRTFIGFHFYFHGYSEPMSTIHYAMVNPFYRFSASYGFVLGTKF